MLQLMRLAPAAIRSPTLLAAAFCAAIGAVALPPPAGAQVTVGAPLTLPANVAEGCEDAIMPALRPVLGVPSTCTYWGFDGGDSWTSQTPRGGWRIVRARVRTGPRVGPMAFTVLRAMRSQAQPERAGTQGIMCCTAPVESQVFVPRPNAVNEIPVNLPVVNTVEIVDGEPIEIVDYLGITLLSRDSSLPLHAAPGSSSTGSLIAPGIRAGGQALASGSFFGRVVLVSADYVGEGAGRPSFTLLPGATLLRNGNAARLGLGVPGPGILRAASPARARVASAAAAKRKRRGKALLRPANVRVKREGRARIVVRLTRAGRLLRARRGRLRIPVRVSFKPSGGPTATKTRKVTFARPKPKRRNAGRRNSKRR